MSVIFLQRDWTSKFPPLGGLFAVIVYDFGRKNAPGAAAVRLHFVLGRIMQPCDDPVHLRYLECNRDIDDAARALYTSPPPPRM